MIYDKEITICALAVGAPLQGKLTKITTRLCGERSVFANRFWNAVQAGSRIDTLVELPRTPWDDFCAEMYALMDEHVYRIEQAQQEADENNRPVWILSLTRAEGFFDISMPVPEVNT